jgi:hypothetical protein
MDIGNKAGKQLAELVIRIIPRLLREDVSG